MSALRRYLPTLILIVIAAVLIGIWVVFKILTNDPIAVIEDRQNEVKIGYQVWSLSNLDVDHFRNGDPIPEAKTEGQWKAFSLAAEPAWCACEVDSLGNKTEGKLYNFYAVNDRRGLAPDGWHIPTKDEWIELMYSLGGENRAGAKMKTTTDWPSESIGTNSSHFNGKPFCSRTSSGQFQGDTASVYWWSSSSEANETAWYSALTSSSYALRGFSSRGNGYAVRCIKN